MHSLGFNFDTSYLTLPSVFFAEFGPEPVAAPQVVILNKALATSMGLDFSGLTADQQAQLFAGHQMPEGATPLAQAYAGHQFGNFAVLGDGRALLWGEHITPTGQRLDIQFKGSGRTPYSRGGDGKAALGPMLREYIISEAMHHLGIPTTRSLAVVATGEPVMRDTPLPGAILTRVASSHIRFGTFEFAARTGERPALRALMEYTIARHYPELSEADNKPLALLEAVMQRQADLVVHWMRVGFIHGVMNTDNMTLSGEAIDFGPCAFMDSYDPKTVFSSIDHMGRYAFGNQPRIVQWNLARLAEALLVLIDDDVKKAVSLAEQVIDRFADFYQQKWLTMMRAKLGILDAAEGDIPLFAGLLEWMGQNQVDYTNLFYDLTKPEQPVGGPYDTPSFKDWYQQWQARLDLNTQSREESLAMMQSVNPVVIPRNHNVEQALDAANNSDFGPFHDLLAALANPYQDRDGLAAYQNPPAAHERVHQTFCGT